MFNLNSETKTRGPKQGAKTNQLQNDKYLQGLIFLVVKLVDHVLDLLLVVFHHLGRHNNGGHCGGFIKKGGLVDDAIHALLLGLLNAIRAGLDGYLLQYLGGEVSQLLIAS